MLPQGLRFKPLDHEVICFLMRKAGLLTRKVGPCRLFQDIDLYSLNPDQLSLNDYDEEERKSKAYFCTNLHRKDGDGKPDRSTSDGYWEEIGGDVVITYKTRITTRIVGYKSTFVFRFSSADDGKDNFYLDEFRLNPSLRTDDPTLRNNIKNMVVCKVERMSPNCFLIPKVEWVKGANECSDDEVEEEAINTSPESV